VRKRGKKKDLSTFGLQPSLAHHRPPREEGDEEPRNKSRETKDKQKKKKKKKRQLALSSVATLL
jgi:hypothetical protein